MTNNPKGKKKKMANPNMVADVVPAGRVIPVLTDPKETGKIKGTVKRKVEDPFSGTEIERKGHYEFEAATDLEHALLLCGENESEAVFWFNFGRKTQAAKQTNAALQFDLGSEKMNDLYGSFTRALTNMLEKGDSKERREEMQQFVLSIPKFKELRERLDEMKAKGIGEVTLNFGNLDADGKVADGEIAFSLPDGKRGAKKKVVADPNSPTTDAPVDEAEETEETEETES